jgi:hypothetical protein
VIALDLEAIIYQILCGEPHYLIFDEAITSKVEVVVCGPYWSRGASKNLADQSVVYNLQTFQ